MKAKVSSERKKKLCLYYGEACLLVCLIAFFVWFFLFYEKVHTNDAYVEGNQVFITPLRSGFIQAIYTDDTFLAKQDQLLIELDSSDARLAFQKASSHLAKEVRGVCSAYHQLFAYRSEIKVKEAEYIRTMQDFEHREKVIEAGGVSLEDYEHAVAALRASFYSLKWTKSLYDKEMALLQGTSIRNHPLVTQAEDRFKESWLQLYRTKIYSPVEGLVAQRKIQVGMWVKAGEPVLSVIPLDQIWVNANFKETQLKKVRIGQKAKLTSDLYGKKIVYRGKVVGLPGGSGNVFSLLPPQNLSGNWIKIVQRLPVRIALDPKQLKKYPLRIGLSMEITLDLRDQEGALVPDSSEGSPTYSTLIYEKEERGDKEAAEAIIKANMDPLLYHFTTQPLMEKQMQDE